MVKRGSRILNFGSQWKWINGRYNASVALLIWKGPPVSIQKEVGWATEPVWMWWWEITASAGNRTTVIHPLGSHYTELLRLMKCPNSYLLWYPHQTLCFD